MIDNELLLPIVALVISGAAGTCVAIHVAKATGRPFNFRSISIVNYVVVGNISGVVHLLDHPGSSRGFYDVIASGAGALEVTTLGTIAGLLALCLGCIRHVHASHPRTYKKDYSELALIPAEKRFLTWFLLGLAPLTIFSVLYISEYASTLNSERVISVGGGNARYSFISSWFAWTASLAAILVMSIKAFSGRIAGLVVVFIAVAMIGASLVWTGGRSVIVVMAAPLLFVVASKLGRLKWFGIGVILIGALAYIISATERRQSQHGFDLIAWIDWEWGRFSMLGYAQETVTRDGYVLGETILYSLVNVLLGIFRLLGLPLINPDLRSSSEIASAAILHDSSARYIVPGLNAELYLNFGILGIVGGMLALGLLTSWVDIRFVRAEGPILRLLFAYLGVLLVLRTVSADSGSMLSYVIYTGLPLLLAAAFSAYARSERRRVLAHKKIVRQLPSATAARRNPPSKGTLIG